jgi:hypothetical protein
MFSSALAPLPENAKCGTDWRSSMRTAAAVCGPCHVQIVIAPRTTKENERRLARCLANFLTPMIKPSNCARSEKIELTIMTSPLWRLISVHQKLRMLRWRCVVGANKKPAKPCTRSENSLIDLRRQTRCCDAAEFHQKQRGISAAVQKSPHRSYVRIEAPVRIDGTLNEYLVQSRSLVVTANFQITNDATVIEATLFSESLIQQ